MRTAQVAGDIAKVRQAKGCLNTIRPIQMVFLLEYVYFETESGCFAKCRLNPFKGCCFFRADKMNVLFDGGERFTLHFMESIQPCGVTFSNACCC